MATVQLPVSERVDTQMEAHKETKNTDLILVLEFQSQLSNASHKHGILDHGKPKKCQ